MTETFDVRTPFKAGPAFGFPSELTESVTMFLFCSCTTLEIQSIVNLSMFYSGTPIFQEGRKLCKVTKNISNLQLFLPFLLSFLPPLLRTPEGGPPSPKASAKVGNVFEPCKYFSKKIAKNMFFSIIFQPANRSQKP